MSIADRHFGPWQLGVNKQGFDLYELRHNGQDQIATIKTQDDDVAELIAKAPTMLLCLRRIAASDVNHTQFNVLVMNAVRDCLEEIGAKQ